MMANTPADYKREYEQFNAETLRQFGLVLATLSGTDAESTNKWMNVAVSFIIRRRRLANQLAARQFRSYREALNIPGSTPEAPETSPLDRTQFIESIKATALVPLYQADRAIAELDAEDSYLATSLREEAQRRSLVAGSGVASRYTQESFMDTMESLSDSDPESTRYRRITSGGSCSWCALLATRGAVYLSSRTALSSHDFCRCIAMPDYGKDDDPNFKRAEDIWDSVAKDGHTGKEAVNEFRRRYDEKTETARRNRVSVNKGQKVTEDGRNPLDAGKSTDALRMTLAGLEKSLTKHPNKPTATRISQIRAELNAR